MPSKFSLLRKMAGPAEPDDALKPGPRERDRRAWLGPPKPPKAEAEPYRPRHPNGNL